MAPSYIQQPLKLEMFSSEVQLIKVEFIEVKVLKFDIQHL